MNSEEIRKAMKVIMEAAELHISPRSEGRTDWLHVWVTASYVYHMVREPKIGVGDKDK